MPLRYLRRRLQWAVAVLLVTGLAVNTSALVLLARSLDGIRGASVTACQLANVTRAQDITLWNHVLDAPARPRPGETAAQQARQIAAFRAYVHQVFAPRDCTAIYGR